MDLQDFFPIWAQLTPSQQRKLSESAIRRSIPKGTMLHSGSTECTGLLLVCSGQLRAFILSDEGREITLYRLFERDICLFSASCMLRSMQFEIMIAAEKDTELFNKIAEALAGKNILVLSARDENYKTVGASAGLAYGQKVGAESAVDINLAKQLNTVMTQLGVNAQSIVMNIGSAAAGYGYEYVASTLDRVKDAALKQADAMLQMPIMTPVSADAWGVKEAVMSEADMPEWGNQEERGVEMEVTTAAAVLAGGSDAVIMRHPAAIRTIAKMINALM